MHAGAQQTFDDIDGYRFTVLATNQPEADIVLAEQRHRARARIEDRVRQLKSPGLRNLPCGTFARNGAWLELSLLALTLLTWMRVLTLDGDQARAEPDRLRYKLFHTAACITRTGGGLKMHLQHDRPFVDKLHAAFQRLAALPRPRELSAAGHRLPSGRQHPFRTALRSPTGIQPVQPRRQRPHQPIPGRVCPPHQPTRRLAEDKDPSPARCHPFPLLLLNPHE